MAETAAPTIWQLFAEAKREIGPVGKDSKNKQQNYNFRGIDAVVNAVAKAFDAKGIIPVPRLQKLWYGTAEIGKDRTQMGHVQVEVEYQFTGPQGDHIDVLVPGEAMDVGDKATAKAMSVAYRIALLQALNLPTSDADPDSQTYERSPRETGQRYAHTDAAHERLVPGQSAEDRANGKKAERIKGKAPGDEFTVTDKEWMAGVEDEIRKFTSDDYGRVLWRRVNEKVEAGGCNPLDGEKLQTLIRARHQALAVEREPETAGA